GNAADANAPAGRYTVSGGTVYDTKTKLTWQRTAPTTTYAWADAKTYCASAATSAALGGTGWRRPTTKELPTLVDHTQPATGSKIDQDAFQGTQGVLFWSSTPDASFPSLEAWAVNFGPGYSAVSGLTATLTVRCVR